MTIGEWKEENEHLNITKETHEKVIEIEKELRRMQKEWIDMYEKIIHLMNEGK